MTYRENGKLAKDDLYLIVLIEDQALTRHLHALNINGSLKVESLKDTLQEEENKGSTAYWYSGEVSIFNMRNKPAEMKERHGVVEHIVIIGMKEIAESLLVRAQLEWGLLDLDVVMVNQCLFTFNRQSGYLYRNDTKESWYWTGVASSSKGDSSTELESYSYYQPSLEFDY